MAVSGFLEFTLMEPAQSQPEVVFNEAVDALDRATSGWFALDGAVETFPFTIDDQLGRYRVLNVYNDPGATFTLIVPSKKRFWNIVNDTPQDMVVKTVAGTGVVVPAWQKCQVYSDGTNVYQQVTAITTETAITDGVDLLLGTTNGTRIGTTPAQKLGLFGATPVSQQSAITPPTGGTTIDAEARTAINNLIAALQAIGITA